MKIDGIDIKSFQKKLNYYPTNGGENNKRLTSKQRPIFDLVMGVVLIIIGILLVLQTDSDMMFENESFYYTLVFGGLIAVSAGIYFFFFVQLIIVCTKVVKTFIKNIRTIILHLLSIKILQLIIIIMII
ncbi:MAG: hypothetical protein PHH04_07995 [Thomasclavelia sp.]|nr:hypothetical protein [Thomasclavelia sp.]